MSYKKGAVEGVLREYSENIEQLVSEANLPELQDVLVKEEQDVHDLLTRVNNICIASLPERISSMPKVFPLVTIRHFDDKMSVFLTLRISRNAVNPLKASCDLSHDTAEVVTAYKNFYLHVLEDSFYQFNLKELNEKVSQLIEDAGLSYNVSFVSPFSDAKGIIKYISNEELILVADGDALLNLESLLLFRDLEGADELALEDYNKLYAGLVNSLKEFERPVDLLINKHGLVVTLAGNFRSKVQTLIKKSVSRNFDGIAKVKKDIQAVYSTDEVLAIVERVDGQLGYVFGPVNAETLESVDLPIESIS